MDDESDKPKRPIVKAPTPHIRKKTVEEDDETEHQETSGLLSKIPLPKISYMMIGFLLIAGVSGWMNLQQARTVDSIGDVKALENKKIEINLELTKRNSEKRELQSTGKDPKRITNLNETIKELNEEIAAANKKIAKQELDVKENSASMLNGAWFWTLLIQIGSACFGIGIINILMNKKEDARIRSAAIFVIGGLAIFLLLTRILSLIAVKM